MYFGSVIEALSIYTVELQYVVVVEMSSAAVVTQHPPLSQGPPVPLEAARGPDRGTVESRDVHRAEVGTLPLIS